MEIRKINLITWLVLALIVGIGIGQVWYTISEGNNYYKAEAGTRLIYPYGELNSGLKQICFIGFNDTMTDTWMMMEEKNICFMTQGQKEKLEKEGQEFREI